MDKLDFEHSCALKVVGETFVLGVNIIETVKRAREAVLDVHSADVTHNTLSICGLVIKSHSEHN